MQFSAVVVEEKKDDNENAPAEKVKDENILPEETEKKPPWIQWCHSNERGENWVDLRAQWCQSREYHLLVAVSMDSNRFSIITFELSYNIHFSLPNTTLYKKSFF